MTPFGITWTKVESALLPSYLLLCHVVLYIYSALVRKLSGSVFPCVLGDGLPIQSPFLKVLLIKVKNQFSKSFYL